MSDVLGRATAVLGSGEAPLYAAGLLALGLAIGVWLVLSPAPDPRAQARRLAPDRTEGSWLERTAAKATSLISRLTSRERRGGLAHTLDRAGLKLGPADYILLVGAGALAGMAVGSLLAGPVLGMVFMVLAPVGGRLFVAWKTSSRQAAFAEQLDEVLQLLASNLRAGHSLLQSLDALSQEVDQPAADEIGRIVNQVRVGRDISAALDESALRLGSQDWAWLAQAIAIHRQVGGNLADVLDRVGETIRERSRIRRQVRALSAEGRMSGWVLTGLPVAVALLLAVINPDYLGRFTQSFLGYLMLGTAVVLLVVGTLVIRKVVRIEF
jgi:tight adherence protein B